MSGFTLWWKRLFRTSPFDDPGRYDIIHVVGTGTMGDVYVAVDRNTRTVIAIKKSARHFHSAAYREFQFLRAASHPNVVREHGYFETPIDSWLLMEYVPSTLRSILNVHRYAGQTMDVGDVKIFAFQLFRALHHLRSHRIIHGDLKPSNLLVDEAEKVLKLCDFGLAQYARCGNDLQEGVATLNFRAPEVAFGRTNYDCAIDIWAAGLILFEMLTGSALILVSYENEQESESRALLRVIGTVFGRPTADDLARLRRPGDAVPFPPTPMQPPTIGERLKKVPVEAADLIRGCCAYQPNRRLTPIECLAHPFFASVRQLPQCRLEAYELEGVDADVRVELFGGR